MTEAERIEAMFPGKPLLAPEEVARFLDFSRKRVYALTASGVFRPPLVEKMGALLLFRKALLADFVEGRSLHHPPKVTQRLRKRPKRPPPSLR